MLVAGEEETWFVPRSSGGRSGSGGNAQRCSCICSWSAGAAFLGVCKPWAAPAHAFSCALRSFWVPPMQNMPWFYDFQHEGKERVDLASLTFHIWASNMEQLPSESAQKPLTATPQTFGCSVIEPHEAEPYLVNLCYGTSPWMTKQRQGAEVTLPHRKGCATPVHTVPGVSHWHLSL